MKVKDFLELIKSLPQDNDLILTIHKGGDLELKNNYNHLNQTVIIFNELKGRIKI